MPGTVPNPSACLISLNHHSYEMKLLLLLSCFTDGKTETSRGQVTWVVRADIQFSSPFVWQAARALWPDVLSPLWIQSFVLHSRLLLCESWCQMLRGQGFLGTFQFSSVQSLSHVRLFASPWTAARQASLSITNSRSLLRLMSIESVIPSNHLILCHPLLLLPSIFPSIRVFSSDSVLCIRWPEYCSFSFSISPSNEYSGLTSFRMDWLDLLAVQGTLRSLLQHHSSKASVL